MRIALMLSAALIAAPAVVSTAHAADHPAFLRALAETHAAPRADAFAAATVAQRTAVEALCAAPSAVTAEAARQSFRAAFLAWEGLQHLRTGPLELETRADRIQFWPDDRGATRRRLEQILAAADEAAVTPAAIAKASVAVQGFPVLERLLFAPDGAPSAAGGGYPCRYAAGTAQNLADIAGKIAAEWRAAAAGAPLAGTASPAEAVKTLAAAWVGQLDVMAVKKLSDPAAGDVTSAKPGLAEAPLAGLGAAALRANADALAALTKLPALQGATGLAELPRGLESLSDPLGPSLKTPTGRKAALTASLRIDAARGQLVGLLPTALEVELGFNNRDGD